MGYLAQESSVFRKLTVEKNLLGVMELLGYDHASRRRRCKELLEQFDIFKLRKSLAQSLSGGERRRLEIARCLVSKPKIILLDEPFTGIDPVTIDSIQKIIRQLRRRGNRHSDYRSPGSRDAANHRSRLSDSRRQGRLSGHARRSARQPGSPQVLLRRRHGDRPQSERVSAQRFVGRILIRPRKLDGVGQMSIRPRRLDGLKSVLHPPHASTHPAAVSCRAEQAAEVLSR